MQQRAFLTVADGCPIIMYIRITRHQRTGGRQNNVKRRQSDTHLHPFASSNLLRLFMHRDIFNIMYRLDMTRARAIGNLRSLTIARIRPAIRSQRAGESNTTNEGPPLASGTPRPACSPLDGQMIHAHTDVGEEDSDESATNDIESVMPIVEPPR